MTGRPQRMRRSKVEIDMHDSANLKRAMDNPDEWITYEPKVKLGSGPKSHLMSQGLEVSESGDRSWVRWSSGQLLLVEKAPVATEAAAADDDTVARCPACTARTDCMYCQYAAEMIRIKDALITELSSRIVYLEARRDR